MVSDLFGKFTALIATILLSVQPIFFALSGLVLPEMMLTLFSIIALWALIRKRWWVYCLASSLAMLTKESALILPATAFSFIFIEGIVRNDFFSVVRLRTYFFAAVPLLVYGVFLLVQKNQNGWYFFPEHIGYIKFDLPGSRFWGRVALTDLFTRQGRWFVTLFFVAALVVIFSKRNTHKTHWEIATISLVFIFLSFVFSILNFYLSRYILFVIPVIIMMGSYGIVIILRVSAMRIPLLAAIVAAGCLLSIREMDGKTFADASDMSYLHAVQCVQKSIAWTEQQPWKDSAIAAQFPVAQAVSDARNGYLSGTAFPNLPGYGQSARYGMLFHLYNEPIAPWNSAKYEVLKNFDDLFAHVTVVKYK